MALQELTVGLLRAEGVSITLGYRGELKGWITDFFIKEVSFPDQSTEGAYELFRKFQEHAAANRYDLNSINSYSRLIVTLINNGLTIRLVGSLKRDELIPGNKVVLYANRKGGDIPGPSLWEDQVKQVFTQAPPR